jgi:hypothetical protein
MNTTIGNKVKVQNVLIVLGSIGDIMTTYNDGELKVYDIIINGSHRFIRARSYMQICRCLNLPFMDVFAKGRIALRQPCEDQIEDISNKV